MGYYTTFSGRIDISPPLTWEQIRDREWTNEKSFSDFRIEVQEQREETPLGEVVVREGVAIVPWQEDPYKGYSALNTLKEIVRAFPGHEFTGEIRGEGEEPGDIRRYVPTGGTVEEWKAVLTWPDGTLELAR